MPKSHQNGGSENGYVQQQQFLNGYNSPRNTKQLFFLSSWRNLCTFSISLPFSGLFICLATACVFQHDQVMENSCKVYNILPSISAIIGIAPQCYLWRLLVAFHLGPRLLLPPVYYKFYKSHFHNVAEGKRRSFAFMNSICYWLSLLEIVAFTAVSYISNRDNYPIHEKLFITYLTSSVLYMAVSLYVFLLAKPKRNSLEEVSLKIKKWCLIVVVLGVGIMIYFYRLHRVYCTPFAFTWFAFSEYVVAVANMGFHYTLALDFPEEKVSVGTFFSVSQHTISNQSAMIKSFQNPPVPLKED